MAAAHTRQTGRVTTGTILWRYSDGIRIDGRQSAAGSGEDGGSGDPVNKITPGNRPPHAEAAQPCGGRFASGHGFWPRPRPLTPALSPRAGRGRDPRSGRVRGGKCACSPVFSGGASTETRHSGGESAISSGAALECPEFSH